MAGTKISALTELGAGGLASGDFFVVVDTDVGTTKKIDADNILDVISTAFTRTLLDDSDAATFMTTLGITAFAQTILDDANAATVINTLGIDADIITLSIPANCTISAFMKTVTDDADAEAAKGTLEVAEPQRKNLIINGDFNVAQRGTSFASITGGAYSLDRWMYGKTGTMVHTITQDQASFPTIAQSGHSSKNTLKIDCTTADAAIAAGDYCYVSQRIEGYNMTQIIGKTVTLSFWVRSAKTGIHCVSLRNSGTDRCYLAEYTIAVADNWEKQEITFDMNACTAGTWNFSTGVGLEVHFTLACGSNFHGTKDTWNTSSVLATSNQVNVCDNAANDFYLSQVMLEVSDVATNFDPGGSIQQQLLDCYRYYLRLNKLDGNTRIMSGTATALTTTIALGALIIPIEMRTTPTIAGLRAYRGNAAIVVDDGPVALDAGHGGCVQLTDTGVAAMVVDEAYVIQPNLSSESPTFCSLSAEL